MIEVTVYNHEGKESGKIKLPDSVFAVKGNPALIHEVVVGYLANRREVVAHTKNRGEVRGGGKKPWRQKGTGRARHGSIRSPLWRGGGITFGPRNVRNFSKKVNTKAKQKALAMALTEKVSEKKFFVLDAVSIPEAKTKLLAALLKNLPAARSHLLILDTKNEQVLRAAKNLPTVDLAAPRSLHTYDVLSHDAIVINKKAVEKIAGAYTKSKA